MNKTLVIWCSLILTAFFSLPYPVQAQALVSIYLDLDSLTVNFDKPKGSVAYYEVNDTLNFYNAENNTVTLSRLNATFKNVPGISAYIHKSSIQIEAKKTEQINVTFRINSSMAEKSYTGTLSISASVSGSGISKDITVTLKVVHPPATIKASWTDSWGKVKAGSKFTKTLKVTEAMGYKSAKNVSIRITYHGPAVIEYKSFLGDFSPFENKSVKVNVSIPERNLKPGTYPIRTTISSISNISTIQENASYIIPSPQMVLSSTTLDLGKVTFEAGKESSEGDLIIQEVGGYTPIEGLTINLTSGEVGWITVSEKDYIPPGGAERYTFKVYLPQDGTLGKKTWKYTLHTNYAGNRQITVKVLVYFSGVEEALSYLRGTSYIPEYPETKTLITSAINLLEKTKGTVDTKKIVSVMSIYSGARTFLNNIENAVQNKVKGNLVAMGDSIIRAHRSLTKMKVGEENLDSEFRSFIRSGISSAETVWTKASEDAIRDMVEAADKARESDYKKAVTYYKRLSQIYVLRGDEKKAEEYSILQKEMEGLYKDYLTYATGNLTYAEDEKEKALGKTFKLRDVSFVLNPLAYDTVSHGLENAIEAYKIAERMFRITGEKEEADLLLNKIAKTEEQYNSIKRSFMVYGFILVALLVGFLIRTSLAIQRYRHDEEEGILGDIVLKGEEKIR